MVKFITNVVHYRRWKTIKKKKENFQFPEVEHSFQLNLHGYGNVMLSHNQWSISKTKPDYIIEKALSLFLQKSDFKNKLYSQSVIQG